MQKIETKSSSQEATIPSSHTAIDLTSAAKQQGFWVLIVLATLLLLSASWFAWKQVPHPDAYRTVPGWLSSDYWWYPIERNAFKRQPMIRTGLHAIHVHLDGQRIWVAGSNGSILYSKNGGKTWQEQVSGTDELLLDITFAGDGQRGWVVGNKGIILHTTDGGKNWQAQSSGIDKLLSSIAMAVDNRHGWAVGEGGVILRTENGGKNWHLQHSNADKRLKKIITAGDGQRGWVVGEGVILNTINGGNSWHSIVKIPHLSLGAITFAGDDQRILVMGGSGFVVRIGSTPSPAASIRTKENRRDMDHAFLDSVSLAEDGQRGWAVGTNGTILRTKDGGINWEEQVSGTRERLTNIIAMKDGQRGWVVGSGGTILYTEDGGKSWQVQANGASNRLMSIATARNGQLGWAVGKHGTILKTEDGGNNWETQVSGTGEYLRGVAVAGDGQRGWVVGSGGTILRTEDGGKSWQVQVSGTYQFLRNITISGDSQRGWVVGNAGVILHTQDGGRSWHKQSRGNSRDLYSIAMMADGQRGWVVGSSGTILHTEDGGENWHVQANETQKDLISVVFAADGQHGWVVGTAGTILHTQDGGKSWQAQASETQEILVSIVFAADGQHGWVVGTAGTILHTQDGGRSWQKQSSGTPADLYSIALMADGQHSWVVGSGGTILNTEDGGKSWKSITYRVSPARWFYVVPFLVLLLYAAAFAWRAWQIRQAGRQIPVRSVSDHVATDRPVSLGEPDFLGARRVAIGLTRFLINDKTEPPLTLAITGEWGSGKSSLMKFLFTNLKREGLRPVWFNAWHHREEQNVLASILAKVQQEAIKPWWHPAGFWFRGRLWWQQHLLWKVLMLITLFCLFFAMTWLIQLPKDKWRDTLQYARYWLKIDQPVMLSMRGFEVLCPNWTDSPQLLNDDVVPTASGSLPFPGKKPQPIATPQPIDHYKPIRASNHFDFAQCKALHDFSMRQRKVDALHCITDVIGGVQQACFATPVALLDNIERHWEGSLLPKDEALIREVLDFLQPDPPVPLPVALTGWIAALFTALLFIAGKSMALLGLTSMQFIQTVVTRLRGVQQPIEKVGTRLLFEKYFKDITKLLGSRRLVLFIDDLDRCDCDYTRRVLEVTNFLSSSGTLFIVIGMAPRYVLANVILSFQDTAKVMHEVDMRNGKSLLSHDPNVGQSWFARHYLQKLINIEVPVPKPDTVQVKALLKNEVQSLEQEEDRKLEKLEKSEKRIDDTQIFLGKLFQIIVILSVISCAIYLAGSRSIDRKVLQPVPESVQSVVATPPKITDSAEQASIRTEITDSAEQASIRTEKAAPKLKEESESTERRVFIEVPSKDASFVALHIWIGVSAVVLVVLLGAFVYQLIHNQDSLADQRWWWLKPLLKRLKVTVFGPEVTQDTKDFTVALDIWYELIARKDPTPRNIKAFKNHLRYLASRDNQPPENSREAHLVALATLFYVDPRNFDEVLQQLDIYFSDEKRPSTLQFEERCPDLVMKMIAHQNTFGRIPSMEDIQFFKSMAQDLQIHRPIER